MPKKIFLKQNSANDMETKIVLTSRQGKEITFSVKNGKISDLENKSGVSFPFSEGQPYNQGVKFWAKNNGFKWNGESLEDDKKIFGIKTKDVPMGHEWRKMFPNKFR